MQGREEGRDQVSAAKANVNKCVEPTPESVSFVCVDAHKEIPTIKSLYDSFIAAKRECGEPIGDLSFSRFHNSIASKADSLKERLGCRQVEFSISIENGHVSFKAKGYRTPHD